MNYHAITTADIANGKGFRVVLWVAGCSHRCKGCQNPETWDFEGGKYFDEEALEKVYELLDKPYIKGITFSGGDPLEPQNYCLICHLAKWVKMRYPDKDVWAYTGYKYEYISKHYSLNNIDVIVDGPYEEDKRDISLAFRGSSNQRIIDVKKSKQMNTVVLWQEET